MPLLSFVMPTPAACATIAPMMSEPWRTRLWPLFALALLTLALTWPLAWHLTSHVIDRQDPLLNGWIMAWEAHQLLRDPLNLFQANIFYPQPNTLAFSEILLSTTALVLPLRWAGASAVTALNSAYLLSFFLTALGGYLLALELTGRRGPALLGALALAFSPYRFGHLSQLQLLAFGWLPLALLFLDRLLRGRGHWQHNSALLTLFLVLQALASFYAALFAALACAFYVCGWLLLFRQLRREALLGGLVALVVSALVLLPLARPYFQVQQTLGAGWTLEANETFSASVQAYLYAPAGSLLWGSLTSRFAYTYGPCCPPDTLFPGVTLLALTGLTLLAGRGRRRWLLLALLLLAFLLSLGPRLHLWAGQPTSIVLPYRWLFEHLPGFQALRAPVRWAALVSLALSLLAACGLATLQRRAAPPLARIVAPAATLLLLLEFAAVPLQLVELPPEPPVVAWLAAQPTTRIVELPLAAELPGPAAPPDNPVLAWRQSRLIEHQFASTRHWHATPDGYSGYIPPSHGDFVREIAAFPTTRSVALLQGLGIELVVLHEPELTPARLASIRAALPRFPALTIVTQLPGATVLRVAPSLTDTSLAQGSGWPLAPNAPPTMLHFSVLASAPVPAGQPAPLWLEIRNAAEPVTIFKQRQSLDLRWVDHDDRPLGPVMKATVNLPLLVDAIATVPLTIPAPATPGSYRLLVESGDGRWHAEGTVLVQAGHTGQPPRPLPVRLVSASLPAQVQPGQLLPVSLAWETLQPLDRYFSLSLRLLDPASQVIGQQDGPPGASTGTLTWNPGVPYQAIWEFAIPPNTPPGQYTLEVLWYDPATAHPTLLWGDQAWQERLPVGSLTIQAK
jgi:hypothetical protein